MNSGTPASEGSQVFQGCCGTPRFMTFARTWAKVLFMRFDRGMTGEDGSAATAVDVESTASTGDSGTRPERLRSHGSLRIERASALATATNRSAAPSKFITDPDPLWSQLTSTEPSPLVACPQSTKLMISSSPILLPAAHQAARLVASKPRFMSAAPARLACIVPPKLHPAITFFMSESFVHRSNIAGCECFARRLPSGPHEEGCHATQ
jgi:hypothetical protein